MIDAAARAIELQKRCISSAYGQVTAADQVRGAIDRYTIPIGRFDEMPVNPLLEQRGLLSICKPWM